MIINSVFEKYIKDYHITKENYENNKLHCVINYRKFQFVETGVNAEFEPTKKHFDNYFDKSEKICVDRKILEEILTNTIERERVICQEWGEEDDPKYLIESGSLPDYFYKIKEFLEGK